MKTYTATRWEMRLDGPTTAVLASDENLALGARVPVYLVNRGGDGEPILMIVIGKNNRDIYLEDAAGWDTRHRLPFEQY